jgi:hypothetical protein
VSMKSCFCQELIDILELKNYITIVQKKLNKNILKNTHIDGTLQLSVCFDHKEDSSALTMKKYKKILIDIPESFLIPRNLRGKSYFVKYHKLIYSYLLRN